VAVAAVVTAGLAAQPATASPLDDARAEAAQVEAQLEAQGQRVSELDERYNQARLAAGRSERALTGAKAALETSEKRLVGARARLAAHATQAYIHGGAGPMLDQLVQTNGPDLAVRRRYLETALDVSDRALRAVEAAKRDLTRRTAALGRVRDANRDAASHLGADREAAAAAAREQEATLAQIRVEVARLVAADEARVAAATAQRARAALARARIAAPRSPAATSRETSVPRRTVAPPAAPAGAAGIAVTEAARQLGKPYVWAGAGPDVFDCSGLTMWAWRAAGVTLSHSAEYQFRETRRVELPDLQAGDLVFFGEPIHHVGIYVGDETMIEAPHTGAVVRYRSIWRSDLVGAGRPY
jgi:cell wall-associated NlpC family hydrolase